MIKDQSASTHYLLSDQFSAQEAMRTNCPKTI